MQKVVIDTNVVVSAAISPYGNPAKILDMVFDNEILVCYCDGIMDEYENVLSRTRLNIAPDVKFKTIRAIRCLGMKINQTVSSFPLPDESDRFFYDTAKYAEAILITGNVKHYPAESFIMTPADFLVWLEGKPFC
jgi:putative PIN family toxin of toxin-antitoxin system